MSSMEITEWMAFYSIEPFGEKRADLRLAINSCVMANAWAGKNKTYEVEDFMPRFDPKPQQSVELMRSLLEGFANRGKCSNTQS